MDVNTARNIYQTLEDEQDSIDYFDRLNEKEWQREPIYRLFHYTSTEVLDKLLVTSAFRASNIFYLNDFEEYKEGIKTLRVSVRNNSDIDKEKKNEIFKEISSISSEGFLGGIDPELYSVSFSQERDSLYQWITYAKESGVSVELDYKLIDDDKECRWLGIEASDGIESVKGANFEKLLYFDLNINLKRIVYKSGEYNYAIKTGRGHTRERLMWLASFYKQEGFTPEREVRISVFSMENNELDLKAKVDYFRMGKKGILRPYITIILGCVKHDDNDKEFQPCLPLKSITIGPSGNQQAVFDSVVHRLKHGKCNVYDYSEKECMKNIFCKFIQEIIEWLHDHEYITESLQMDYAPEKRVQECFQFKKSDDKTKVLSVAKRILAEWVEKNNLSEECNKWINGIDACLEEDLMREVYNNFYLSKEGIVVRKSKISYVF